MIIYLYGPDSYRRRQKLTEIINTYRSRYQHIDLSTADFEEEPDGWERVRDFLNQPSMFVDSKVAVVEGGGSCDERRWVALLKSHRNTEKVFIVISDTAAPRKPFQFLLSEPVAYQAFPEPDGAPLETFMKREARSRNLVFTADAWRFLATYVAAHTDRSWLTVNELEKLRLGGFAQPISLGSVRSLIPWARTQEVFRVAREVALRHSAVERLCLIERGLLEGVTSPYLFNSLAYQVRGSDIVRLADYDVAVKSGSLEHEEALTGFALGFSWRALT